MTSWTTEQRIASCFQRIQILETTRTEIINQRTEDAQFLLEFPNAPEVRVQHIADFTRVSDEVLIQIDNQKEALRRLVEHLSGLLAAFPRPQPTSG